MKSAGEVPGSTPGAAPGGLAAPPPAIWNPSNWSNFYNGGGINMNANIALDGTQGLKLLQGQQKQAGWGMIVGGLGTMTEAIGGMILASQQLDNIEAYYNTERKTRKYDMKVAIRALKSQDHAVDAQYKAYKKGLEHERGMAKIQKETQIAITRIQERGKTQRAEILSSSQAFSVGDPLGRDARFYGYGMS